MVILICLELRYEDKTEKGRFEGMKKLTYILCAGLLIAVVVWLMAWIHHMFVSGLNPFLNILFIILVILLLLPAIFWGFRKLQVPPWMLFAMGAVSWMCWVIAWQIWGNNSTIDIHLDDTYYIIESFPFLLLLPLFMIGFSGIYYFLERKGFVNKSIGQFHFWITFVACYFLFWPAGSYEGLAGMPRRYIDYAPALYRFAEVNRRILFAAVIMLITQAVFVAAVINFIRKGWRNKELSRNS